MKIGCHAVLFGEKILTNTEEVLGALSRAGADGVEVGARFFGESNSEPLKSMMTSYGMELSGFHKDILMTKLLDNPEECFAVLESCVRFLETMPNKNIILTGMIADLVDKDSAPDDFGDSRLLDPVCLKQMAQSLNQIVRRIKDQYGITVRYHNHSWEFKRNAIIFNALMEYAPDLQFALDVGWAGVEGYNALEIMKRAPDRFHYLHLRDFNGKLLDADRSFNNCSQSYLPLGQGDIDYKALMAYVKEALDMQDWVVIEYETGPQTPDRYIDSMNYIKRLLTN